ncbi:winged helix-turn-helix domain-containing protein [Coralliovum pocilloporae]|uniref:winged helix-turn-helix domain-containing protein n=1 Tax=Coralliovum pocilloporae TaxID=3066369 RepID=UPI00330765E3
MASNSDSTLSNRQARRIALAAQGFLPQRRSLKRFDRRHLDDVFKHTGLLQIDSVNVIDRAHYLTLFARLGAYDKSLIDKAAHIPGKRDHYFEYWGHEASILPVELQPLLRWRMERARNFRGLWRGIADFVKENPHKLKAVLDELRDNGPSGVSNIGKDEQRTSPWWGWHDTKIALEFLFWTGDITSAGRHNFERIYDLPERALPSDILNTPTPDEPEAHRALMTIAARCHGVGTEKDLRDYFRLDAVDGKRACQELVEEGTLVPVHVEGWSHHAYLYKDARVPARARCRALLAPFDSLIWERSRTERLFNFFYRLEIYTPEPKRQYGYYVLPFLLNDSLVARTDLKANRQDSILEVRATHSEKGIDQSVVVPALAEELSLMASWLGLDAIRIHEKGDLSTALSKEIHT